MAIMSFISKLTDRLKALKEAFKENIQEPSGKTYTCGKYELRITYQKTGKNSWNHSKGKIYNDGKLIAEICRNYCSFPFLFIEAHPNGHSYLICGEDYQGQTVIELDTGKRRDYLPDSAKQGFGFCWANYEFYKEAQILVVDGCFWACPYEFRFYDFSDPMNGWPELTTEDCIYNDCNWPDVDFNGIIKCFETEDDSEEIKSIKTFKRNNNKLDLLNEWVSEAEQKARKDREEADRAREAWVNEFKNNDPLYKTYKSRLEKETGLNPATWESRGITHDQWCPDFKEHETRWCRRINEGKSKGYTIDLEWAVKTGPIKLVIFKDGKHVEDKFFDHSTDGMNQAFDLALKLISEQDDNYGKYKNS